MDNFLSTLIFLFPGVLAYFWLQAFGVNPVTKHTTAEFTGVTVLLWFPVASITIFIYNGIIMVSSVLIKLNGIWSMPDLKNAAQSLPFLFNFLILSIIVSYVIARIWTKWGNEFLRKKIINPVRESHGVAPFSEFPSVWDEVFMKNEPQVVEIGKIDKSGETLIGQIKKVSRPFEPERNLYLDEVEKFKKLNQIYELPIDNYFVDTKTGTYVKIFNTAKVIAALAEMENENDSTSF